MPFCEKWERYPFFIRKINKQFSEKCLLQNVQIIILATGYPFIFHSFRTWLKTLNTKQHCFSWKKKTFPFVIFYLCHHFSNRSSTYVHFNAECSISRHRQLRKHDNIFHGICFFYVFIRFVRVEMEQRNRDSSNNNKKGDKRISTEKMSMICTWSIELEKLSKYWKQLKMINDLLFHFWNVHL